MTREKFNEAKDLFDKKDRLEGSIKSLSIFIDKAEAGEIIYCQHVGYIPAEIIRSGCEKYINLYEEDLAELEQIINCL